MVYIFLDDLRVYYNQKLAGNNTIIRVKNYSDCIFALDSCIKDNESIIIDFDHDLGEEKSGYDVAKWIIENGYEDIKFHIHSMNPVGAKNIRDLLSHYGYQEV